MIELRDVSLTSLRVFRAVAERGTLTAAAGTLGYTQSAVSRQVASLERVVGERLLERRHDGVRLTAAGQIVLRGAIDVLDRLDTTARELSGAPSSGGTVRLGWFPSAGAVLVPQAIAALRRSDPDIAVVTREGATPALVRALRAGTVDLAMLASVPPFRPLDAESPALEVETLSERSLRLAVPAGHPFAKADSVAVADLRGQRWIATSSSGDGQLGVWPGLDERPLVAHVARDWLAKLQLVAAGCGLTTVPVTLIEAVPDGVQIVTVRDGPREQRRLLLARLPRPLTAPAERLAQALRVAARAPWVPADRPHRGTR